MRLTPARRAHHVARFPFKLIRLPIHPVGAAFDHNFLSIFRHYTEQTITVYNSKRLDALHEFWRLRGRFKRAINKPGIERQTKNQNDNGGIDCELIWKSVATALSHPDSIAAAASTQ